MSDPARVTVRPRTRAVKQNFYAPESRALRARHVPATGPRLGTLRIVHVSRRRFEALVADALDDLPEDLLEHSENVVVLVEDAPPADAFDTEPGAEGDTLFGLYEGVAHTERGIDAPFLPDRITLFRLPLAGACADEDELFAEIRVTLVHEFAHHFGIDDDRLDELGWA